MKGIIPALIPLLLANALNAYIVKLDLPEQIVHRYFSPKDSSTADQKSNVPQLVKADTTQGVSSDGIFPKNSAPNILNLKSAKNNKERQQGKSNLLALLKHKKTPIRTLQSDHGQGIHATASKDLHNDDGLFKIPKSFWFMLDTTANNEGSSISNDKGTSEIFKGGLVESAANGRKTSDQKGKYTAQEKDFKKVVDAEGKLKPAKDGNSRNGSSNSRKAASTKGVASLRSLVLARQQNKDANSSRNSVESKTLGPGNANATSKASKVNQEDNHSSHPIEKVNSSTPKVGNLKKSQEVAKKLKGEPNKIANGGAEIEGQVVNEEADDVTTAEEDAEIAQNNADESNSINDEKAKLLEPEQYDDDNGEPAVGKKQGYDDDDDDDDNEDEEKKQDIESDKDEVDDNVFINMATGERFNVDNDDEETKEDKGDKAGEQDAEDDKGDNNKQKKADGIDNSVYFDTSTGLRVNNDSVNPIAGDKKDDTTKNKKPSEDSIGNTEYIDMNNDASNKPMGPVEMKKVAEGKKPKEVEKKKDSEESKNKKPSEDSIANTEYIDMNNDASNKPMGPIEMKKVAEGKKPKEVEKKKQSEDSKNKKPSQDSIGNTEYIDMNNDASNKPIGPVEMKKVAEGKKPKEVEKKKESEESKNKKPSEDSIANTEFVDMKNDASNKPASNVEMQPGANSDKDGGAATNVGQNIDGIGSGNTTKEAMIKMQPTSSISMKATRADGDKGLEDSIDGSVYTDTGSNNQVNGQLGSAFTPEMNKGSITEEQRNRLGDSGELGTKTLISDIPESADSDNEIQAKPTEPLTLDSYNTMPDDSESTKASEFSGSPNNVVLEGGNANRSSSDGSVKGAAKSKHEKTSIYLLKATEEIAKEKNKTWLESEKHENADLFSSDASSTDMTGNGTSNEDFNDDDNDEEFKKVEEKSGKNKDIANLNPSKVNTTVADVSIGNITNAKVLNSSKKYANNLSKDSRNLEKVGQDSEFDSDVDAAVNIAIAADRNGLDGAREVNEGVVLGQAKVAELQSDIKASKQVSVTGSELAKGSNSKESSSLEKKGSLSNVQKNKEDPKITGKDLKQEKSPAVSSSKKGNETLAIQRDSTIKSNVNVLQRNSTPVANGSFSNSNLKKNETVNNKATANGKQVLANTKNVVENHEMNNKPSSNQETEEKQIQSVLQEKLNTARQLYSDLETTAAGPEDPAFYSIENSNSALPPMNAGFQASPYQAPYNSSYEDSLGTDEDKRAMIESESKVIVSELNRAINMEKELLNSQKTTNANVLSGNAD